MFLPLKKFIKTNNQKHMKKVMGALFSEYDDFAMEYMSATFQNCNMDFSPLPIINRKSALHIKIPISLFACENDLMFPGKKMIKRAKKVLQSLDEIILLEDSKHVPSNKDFKKIEESILRSSV